MFRAELELQDGIEQVLTAEGIEFEREVSLAKGDKVDFLIEGSIGLEVKVAGGLSGVTRQLHRYAQSDRIASLLLVTTRLAFHTNLPGELHGKPLEVATLINSVL